MLAVKSPAAPIVCAEIYPLESLLGASTFDVEFLPEIPQILVRTLPLERAVFMVVGVDPPDASPMTSAYQALDDREPRQLSASELSFEDPRKSSRTISMARTIGLSCRIQLQLRWKESANAPADLSRATSELFETLVHMVQVLYTWRTHRAFLGAEFAKLSESQWRALLSMSSDWSEKQLADNLHISHHTLHSHVKGIYLKLGVRSRLEAVRRLQKAVRAYCVKAASPSQTPTTPTPVGDIQVMSKNILEARGALQQLVPAR